MTREELARMLDRNGMPSAAESVLRGDEPAQATEYARGQRPRYDDGEARWIQDLIDAACEGWERA